MKAKTLALFGALGVVLADQSAKAMVGAIAPHAPLRFAIVGGLLPFAIVSALAYAYGWRRDRPFTFAALALIAAGSLSNAIDRVLLGGVRVYIPWFTQGSDFNLADLAICAGVILGIIALARRSTSGSGAARATPGPLE